MRTIQMTLDDDLVTAIDELAGRLGATRSALTRQALRDVLRKHEVEAMERRERAGYARVPESPSELAFPPGEQAWGEWEPN
ncbi:MAG: ribbon-helix-helix domain-containing protein [Planctomycetota bacterium]